MLDTVVKNVIKKVKKMSQFFHYNLLEYKESTIAYF